MRSTTTGAPAVRHLRVLPDQTFSDDYTLTTSSPKQYSLICFGCRFTSIWSVLALVLIHPHGRCFFYLHTQFIPSQASELDGIIEAKYSGFSSGAVSTELGMIRFR